MHVVCKVGRYTLNMLLLLENLCFNKCGITETAASQERIIIILLLLHPTAIKDYILTFSFSLSFSLCSEFLWNYALPTSSSS